jgi:predicted nucleotidyltransferase
MRTAILSTIINQDEVRSVFGFGSYFRGEPSTDVDILVVLMGNHQQILAAYYEIKGRLEALGTRLSVTFDITALTCKEFLERPLLEMDHLVPIYRQG